MTRERERERERVSNHAWGNLAPSIGGIKVVFSK